ncbi:hypothetical protein DFS33DRAFT_9541 [Desarmillaria ectypa]|nr:hypothetical protein DFS33DRAFT_9541 [Desarmillaria ectypa]
MCLDQVLYTYLFIQISGNLNVGFVPILQNTHDMLPSSHQLYCDATPESVMSWTINVWLLAAYIREEQYRREMRLALLPHILDMIIMHLNLDSTSLYRIINATDLDYV